MTYISSSCEINVKVYLKHYLELRILKNINNSVTLNGWDVEYFHYNDCFFGREGCQQYWYCTSMSYSPVKWRSTGRRSLNRFEEEIEAGKEGG